MEENSFLMKTEELNKKIREKYRVARIKDRNTLEGKDLENQMMAIVEPNKGLTDIVSDVLGVICTSVLYEGMDKVKVTYLEENID